MGRPLYVDPLHHAVRLTSEQHIHDYIGELPLVESPAVATAPSFAHHREGDMPEEMLMLARTTRGERRNYAPGDGLCELLGAPQICGQQRGGVPYATGTATRSGNQTRLLLTPRRRVVKGRYTLTLTDGRNHTLTR